MLSSFLLILLYYYPTNGTPIEVQTVGKWNPARKIPQKGPNDVDMLTFYENNELSWCLKHSSQTRSVYTYTGEITPKGDAILRWVMV